MSELELTPNDLCNKAPLTAWPNRDLVIAGQQQATREWWETQRQAFELFVSADVLDEAQRGDSEAAGQRLAALNECRLLSAM